jgi:hypothetical protein
MPYQPATLADLLKNKEDDFGYFWKKEDRGDTVEYVGYDGDTEIGSMVVSHSEDGLKRFKECNWAWEQARLKKPNGISLNDVMEEIRLRYETYKKKIK